MAMAIPWFDQTGEHTACILGALRDKCPTFVGKENNGPPIPGDPQAL